MAPDPGAKKATLGTRLAIDARKPRPKYLVSIQPYAYPSGEPFRVCRRFCSAVERAVFLTIWNSLAARKNNTACPFKNPAMRRAYDCDLEDLLSELDKLPPSKYDRARKTASCF